MRFSMFLSAMLLVGVVASSLLANGVTVGQRLGKTSAGQRLDYLLKPLVGKRFDFCYENSCGVLNNYTGIVKEAFLPDISDFIASGDPIDAELQLVMDSVRAEDPQSAGEELPTRISAKNLLLYDSFPNFHWASLVKLRFPRLGEKILWARKLAIYDRKSISLTNTRWEVLVEMESDGDTHTELEHPFMVTLPMFDFEDPLPLAGTFENQQGDPVVSLGETWQGDLNDWVDLAQTENIP